MRIWHFSDTHGLHKQLPVPECEMAIFSGDEANYRDPNKNRPEFFDFIDWYGKLPIPYKIFVPGNHSSWVERNEKEARTICAARGILFLHNEGANVDGINIWGNALTPTFNDWCFMRDRGTIGKQWSKIPDSTEILVTHGPPKGVLDLSENRAYDVEQVGDSALMSRIFYLGNLKAHLFGHVHNHRSCFNQGVFFNGKVHFSNASCVTDDRMTELSSHGNLFSLDKSTRRVSILQ